MTVSPHSDEFDEAEWRLRQDIEEAIEQAADCKNRLDNTENVY